MNLFTAGMIIGAYSYGIFFLGLLGLLNGSALSILTVIFILVLFYQFRTLNVVGKVNKFISQVIKTSLFEKLTISIIIIQSFVNFVGVLGPELSFDALWYHLTIPKMYLIEGRIFHIPGGLLYYSDMPKLIEMLYVPALQILQIPSSRLKLLKTFHS